VRTSMLLVAIILTVQPDSLFEEQRAQSEVLLFSRLCLSVRYGGDGFEGSPKVQSYAWWSSLLIMGMFAKPTICMAGRPS
jgi:hypothetical protein